MINGHLESTERSGIALATSIPSVEQRPQTDELNYRAFSRCRTYRDECLKMLMELLPYLGEEVVHGDAASGTGIVPQLLQSIVEGTLRTADIYAIDLDEEALRISQQDALPSSACRIHYIRGKVQDLNKLLKHQQKRRFQTMTVFGAIHEFQPEDQQPFLNDMSNALEDGGYAAIHSFFTTIAMDRPGLPETWAKPGIEAARALKGIKKDTRDRLLYREPAELIKMCNRAGFEVVRERTAWVNFLREDMKEGICRYPGFFEGVLSRWNFSPTVTPQLKSDTLGQKYAIVAPLPRQSWGVVLQKVREPQREIAA